MTDLREDVAVSTPRTAFLVDVDDTLLDNDRFRDDLERHLDLFALDDHVLRRSPHQLNPVQLQRVEQRQHRAQDAHEIPRLLVTIGRGSVESGRLDAVDR